MNKKLLKVLQDKCKDFGLTDKAIEELAKLASDGLTDESSDEDIEKKADSVVPYAKAMQGEITRKSQKANPKTTKTKQSKKEGEDEDDEDENDEDFENAPKWFKAYKKQNDAAVAKLQEENEALKAEKAKSERKSHIEEQAKKAGITPKELEAVLGFTDVYAEGDDETVIKALAAIKQVSVNENLPSQDSASILSTSEQAMKDETDVWIKNFPDA